MAVKRVREPSPGATYNGFASKLAGEPPRAEIPRAEPPRAEAPRAEVRFERPPIRNYPLASLRRRKPRRSGLPWFLAGVGLMAAIGLGGLAGYYLPGLLPPPTRSSALAHAPVRPAATVSETGPPVAAAPLMRAEPTPSAQQPPIPASEPPAAQAAPEPAPTPAATPVAAPAKPKPRPKRAALTGCAAEREPTARLLCSDPRLEALDAEVNARYAEAIRSGVPAGALSYDQQTWIMKRDRLANDAPEQVQGLYQDRITLLTKLAQAQAQAEPHPQAQAQPQAPAQPQARPAQASEEPEEAQ